MSKAKPFEKREPEETGVVVKHWGGRVSVCLVYPNAYRVAMSNLGFQTVYERMNRFEHVVCERAFLTAAGPASRPPRSKESGRLLTDFDMVAFSISFENDIPNVLAILESAGIPWLAQDRGSGHPLIAVGGVAVFLNPEPSAPFFDLVFIGEAEGILDRFFEHFDPGEERRENLERIAKNVRGAYVPSFYHVEYEKDGTISSFEPAADVPETMERVYATDISRFSTTSTVMTRDTAFSDSYLIEVSRGCPHGCRFCAAGFVYRPPRFRPGSLLVADLEAGVRMSGKIGLMGAAVSDHPDVEMLCEAASDWDATLSFSSLRADALSDGLIEALKKSGVKTATIAPDAGSQRMRDVINKGVTEDHVLSGTEALVAAGIPNLKLYFMIGLPTETIDDVEAVVSLCKKIKHRFLQSSRARKRIGEISVSLNSFVPKPFTPFQWAAMDDVSVLKKKIQRIKNGLKRVANLRVHADVPRWAYVQGLLSRGDRRVSRLISESVKNEGNWPRTFKESDLNSDFYVLRKRNENEIFPWDFIDHGVKKSFLRNEYLRALDGRTTPPCPADGACRLCGACG